MAEVFPILLTAVIGIVGGYALAVWRAGGASRGTREVETGADRPEEGLAMIEFANTVPPVWSAQVDSCRVQMETAVGGITAQFANIVRDLDSVLASSTAVFDEGHGGAFTRGRERLGGVVSTLDDALIEKRQTIDNLRSLIDLSGELNQMVVDVAQIAKQTNLLALNAGIEAARVGAAGAGFGVVAAEVHHLADRSLRASERIAAKAEAIGTTIGSVLAIAEESAAREGTAVAKANDEVQTVLDDLMSVVSVTRGASEQLEAAAVGIRAEIEKSLVSLQFQDRVCQVLQHLKSSIDRLPAAVARPAGTWSDAPASLDVRALLDDMAADYTMHEERQTHETGAVVQVHESEITFF